MITILYGVTYNYIITQYVSSGGNGTVANPFSQSTQITSVLNESKIIEDIENIPTKCLGSALCPDYDYYPSSV
jgi:hypothetical protein